MNLEENRLRSFDSWPTNAPVDPIQLAHSGFFATGSFLEAECNYCHQRISEWQYGDQIEVRHRMLQPSCPFLVNNSRSENVPMGSASQIDDALLIESNRLATFKNWPNPNISPQSLAKAGFFYLNVSDQVKCAWCKGIIAKWEKQDNAFDEHQRFFPECPRVQLGPLIEMASDGIRDLGIQQISPPKKPKFTSLDARIRTFTNWPIGDIQRPETLAQAGLYYLNMEDHVRCFHCNIGLRSWLKEDDPWFEHAKWGPDCMFVRLVKGASYINEVQDKMQELTQQSQTAICSNISIDEAMETGPVLQALEIGIDGGSIRNATQQRLLCTGRPYDTVEDLVKAVFGDGDDEDTPEEPNSDGAGVSIVREVSRILNNILSVSADTDQRASTSSRAVAAASSGDIPPASTLPLRTETVCLRSENNHFHQTPTNKTTSPLVTISDSSTKYQHSPDRSFSLEEENRKLKDARLCKVCLDEEVAVVFLPCGHLVTCVQCAPSISECPMCRKIIKGFVRTYLS